MSSSWVGPAIQAAGSVLGGALGGKNSGGQKAPQWLRKSSKRLATFGENLAQTPYTPYTGDRVAGFTPDTLAAFQQVRDNIGTSTPAYQSSLGTLGNLQNYQNNGYQAAQWAGQDLSPYMNPYIQNVIDAQAADQQNAYGQSYNNLASQAQAANAFGGSRFGVAQGQLAADSVRNQALISAQLRSQGFDTAANLLQNDVNAQNTARQYNSGMDLQSALLRGTAANQAANTAGQYQTALANDANALGAIGSTQQALAQQGLDVGYNNYLDQRNWPTQQLNWWSTALSPGTQVAGTSTPATSGGASGILGGAMLGSQLGGNIYNWWQGRSAPLGITNAQVQQASNQIGWPTIGGGG